MVRLVRIQDISKDYIVVLLIEVDQRIDKESSVEKWKRMKLLYVELFSRSITEERKQS